MPRVMSLCSGIGGMELAVGGEPVAFAEFADAPAQVLEARFPDVPNIGDWTLLDSFDEFAPDVITAGLPCQPVSTAGKRSGAQDERWLFGDFARVLERSSVRPLVLMENVSAIRERRFLPAMRDWREAMASMGYETFEEMTEAKDAGAPHPRKRWFAVSVHREEVPELPDLRSLYEPIRNRGTLMRTPLATDTEAPTGSLTRQLVGGDHALLPTLRSSYENAQAPVKRGESDEVSHRGGNLAGVLLPTMTVREHKGPTGSGFDERNSRASLSNTLLPTMTAADSERADGGTVASLGGRLLPTMISREEPSNRHTLSGTILGGPPVDPSDGYVDAEGRIAHDGWSIYQHAIDHWTAQLGRLPPTQVQARRDDGVLLRLISAEYGEWHMGYPEGWVTDILPLRPAIKCLGNSVVPQQARLSLGRLLYHQPASLFDTCY